MVDKNKRIKIFYITTKRVDGFTIKVKKYIHPKNSFLWAKFQNLKSDQIAANKQNQNETTAYFIINRRLIKEDMYVEWNRNTFGLCVYQILGIDPYDDNSNDLKISVKQINSTFTFDEVEGTEF